MKDISLPEHKHPWAISTSQQGMGVLKPLISISVPMYGPGSHYLTASVLSHLNC